MSQLQHSDSYNDHVEIFQDKPMECYSLDSLKIIHPMTLVYGPHKGERVISIEEAGKQIRSQLDDANKKGLFKVDTTEKVLLDIRETKLNCEEAK
mmetsp:Transcript_492/g.453  ORF Transcript_492/g.453 Transcript_492/m.453 type:complete len:95 (-) Transcript_492:464-748(-)